MQSLRGTSRTSGNRVSRSMNLRPLNPPSTISDREPLAVTNSWTEPACSRNRSTARSCPTPHAFKIGNGISSLGRLPQHSADFINGSARNTSIPPMKPRGRTEAAHTNRSRTVPPGSHRPVLADLEDTIAAVASPPGPGVRGLVRISGRNAWRIAMDGFRSERDSSPPRRPEVRRGALAVEDHHPVPLLAVSPWECSGRRSAGLGPPPNISPAPAGCCHGP